MTDKKPQRSTGRDQPRAPNVPQAEGKGAAPESDAEAQRRRAGSESEKPNPAEPERRHRSQRTDLLEGDPAGTAFSEEMGHTPTRS